MARRYFLYLLLLLVGFSSCSKNDGPDPEPDPDPEETKAKMTLLVCFLGDNSLRSFVSADFEELLTGYRYKSTDYHLLVFADYNEYPQLLEVTYDGGTKATYNVLKQYDAQLNSCDPAVLKQIFAEVYSSDNYEADHYGLVLWSHGDGWKTYPTPSQAATKAFDGETSQRDSGLLSWFGMDQTSTVGTTTMTVSDLTSALTGVPHLDYIYFDACYMQCIETSYALRSFCDYIIASPMETPSSGSPYDIVLQYLLTPGSELQLAKAYYDSYAATYNDKVTCTDANWTGGASITAIKTTPELDNLATATKNVLKAGSYDYKTLISSCFDYDFRTSSSHIGYFDMAQFIKQVAKSDSDYQTWLSVYNKAVVGYYTTPKNYSSFANSTTYPHYLVPMDGTTGMSHWIPLNATSEAASIYRQLSWYQAAGLSAIF